MVICCVIPSVKPALAGKGRRCSLFCKTNIVARTIKITTPPRLTKRAERALGGVPVARNGEVVGAGVQKRIVLSAVSPIAVKQ